MKTSYLFVIGCCGRRNYLQLTDQEEVQGTSLHLFSFNLASESISSKCLTFPAKARLVRCSYIQFSIYQGLCYDRNFECFTTY